MSRKRLLKSDVVLEYMEKYYPEMPKLTLAKLIYKENPSLFKDVENARSIIRLYAGSQGETSGLAVKRREFFNKIKEQLPESYSESWDPFIIPKMNNNVLVLSDIHIPYHDIDALMVAIEYGRENEVNAILLNGDVMDFYGLSRYEKDPRKRKFEEELEAGRSFLKLMRETFDCPIYYKLGNHEERYQSYLRLKAPELLELHEFRMDILLKFGENRIDLIDDKRIIKAGRLNILHGHEFQSGFGSPVSPAKSFLAKTNSDVLCGHVHRTSRHSEKDLSGNFIQGWTNGCLCELNPDYARINKYELGFAHVQFQDNGDFEVNNIRIVKGKPVIS